jgi:hypothetical protein
MYEVDCHGLTRNEVIQLLIDIDKNFHSKEIKLITGRGNHSKKPIMDYYCERLWKNPLKETILHYIIHEKKEGARLQEYPTFIIWRKK